MPKKPQPAPAKESANQADLVSFAKGKEIFRAGEPGGDLLFIREGTVEIFNVENHREIILATMERGEVIGLMSCLTNAPRMASARAKSDVVCMRVSHENIRKTLKSVPKWIEIIVKEFSIRLAQMNKAYGRSVIEMQTLRETQISWQFIAAQFAAAFASMADALAKPVDDYKVVVIDDMIERLELILNYPREELERVSKVLQDTGIMRIELEPDHKKRVVRLERAKALAEFTRFANEAKTGAKKKLVQGRFPNKDIRVIQALAKYAQRNGMDVKKTCRFTARDLAENLERATGTAFDLTSLERAAAFGLLEIKGEAGDVRINVQPGPVAFTVACAETLRRLQVLDGGQADEDSSAA